MTGPDHYAKAERLVESMRQEMVGSPGQPLRTHEQQARLAAEAQVHATLALAAATIDAAEAGPHNVPNTARWQEVKAP